MYCTLTDITGAIPADDLIELTDDASTGAVNQAVIDLAIADAGELLDGYLRGRYSLPLVPAPGLLKTLAVDVAVWRIYSRRVRLALPEAIDARYKNAIKLLEQIQSGKINLGIGAIVTPQPASSGPQFSAPDRVFTRDTLSDY